jgi:hypothetical protein
MQNRHQQDANTPDLSSCSLTIEWLLEESRQLREEKTALLHHRQALLHERDLLFHQQLLHLDRLKDLASRLQTIIKGTPSYDVGQEGTVDVTEKEDGE